MIMNSQKLRAAIDKGAIDAPYSAVGPASVDLTLGHTFYVEKKPNLFNRLFGRVDLVEPGRGIGPNMRPVLNEVVLQPGDTCICATHEWISLPDWLVGEIRLKSTAGRCFLGHQLAVWIDPGFVGRITLELVNNNRYQSIKLRAGDSVAQLILDTMDRTDTPYRGRYQGDNGPRQAKAVRDAA
jgi:dCTP deaminase